MPAPDPRPISRVALDLRHGATCLSVMIGDEPADDSTHRTCDMLAFIVEAMLRTLETTAAQDVAFEHPELNHRVDLWERSIVPLARELEAARASCARDEEPPRETLRALVKRAREIDAELRGLITFAATEDVGTCD